MTYQARHMDIRRGRTAPVAASPRRGADAARPVFVALTLVITATLAGSVAAGIAVWTGWSLAAMALMLPGFLWIAGGAATSLTGLGYPARPGTAPPQGWQPEGQTAVLMLLCREDPQAVATRLDKLSAQLEAAGLARQAQLIVLSDTFGADAILAEAAALDHLIAANRITYRRRVDNDGRKPGNIAEWFDRRGQDFDHMLVLDADSQMSGQRIRRMIWRMETTPGLGLLQAGMSLVPAQSRFGQVQRISSRVLGPPYAAGLAAWTGRTGNYWGHNALIRTAAFAAAARLPRLSGPAPYGGDILSHDFIEAALIRRAGWAVVFDPDPAGSAEDGPQTLAEFHRRNRRWCQGNLQHLRLVGMQGLHPLSRLHLASGVFGFLAAPLWLALVILMGTGLVTLESGLAFALILLTLLIPKLAGLWRLAGPGATTWRRQVACRALAAELMLSSLLAPIVMLHHTAAVVSVLCGRDCGWKRPGGNGPVLPQGLLEMATGLGLTALVVTLNPQGAAWIAPLVAPMIAAPLLIGRIDAVRPDRCPPQNPA